MKKFSITKDDKWIIPIALTHKREFIGTILLGLIGVSFACGLMFTAGYLITRAAEMPGNIFMLHVPSIFIRIFGFGKPIAQYAQRICSHVWVFKMTSKLRLKLYRTFEKNSLLLSSDYKSGDVLGLLSEDIGHIQNLYIRCVFPSLIGWIISIIFVIALGFMSPALAVYMALTLILITVVMPYVSYKINYKKILKRQKLKKQLYTKLTDNISGISDWIFSGQSGKYLKEHKKIQQDIRKINLSLHSTSSNTNLINNIIFVVASIAVLIWSTNSFGSIVQGDLPSTHSNIFEMLNRNFVAAAVLGFFPLLEAILPISGAMTDSITQKISVQNLNKLDNFQSTSSNDSHETFAEASTEDSNTNAECTANPFDIKIDEMSFAYDDKTYHGGKNQVFYNLNLDIKHGEHLAILGKSGCGKSTLASILRGDFKCSEGSARIGNVPCWEFGDDISKQISFMSASSHIFNMSVADNLRIANKDASPEDMQEALEAVGLSKTVSMLKSGIDTIIDENAKNFSGGEKRRLALARIMLVETPIILLDEPFIGLNTQIEKEILRNILSKHKTSTIILITHHLECVQLMDRVILMKDGNVLLDGNPAKLIESNEHFKKLNALEQGLRA